MPNKAMHWTRTKTRASDGWRSVRDVISEGANHEAMFDPFFTGGGEQRREGLGFRFIHAVEEVCDR